MNSYAVRRSRIATSARLACLIHAANVHSEPGSNPSKICITDSLLSADSEKVQPVCHPGQRMAMYDSLAKNSKAHKLNHVVKDHLPERLASFASFGLTCVVSVGRVRGGAVYRRRTECQSFSLNFFERFSDQEFLPAQTAIPSPLSCRSSSRRTATVIGRSGRKPQGKSHKMSLNPKLATAAPLRPRISGGCRSRL